MKVQDSVPWSCVCVQEDLNVDEHKTEALKNHILEHFQVLLFQHGLNELTDQKKELCCFVTFFSVEQVDLFNQRAIILF